MLYDVVFELCLYSGSDSADIESDSFSSDNPTHTHTHLLVAVSLDVNSLRCCSAQQLLTEMICDVVEFPHEGFS